MDNSNLEQITEIAANFQLDGLPFSVELIPSGHIHTSYVLMVENGEGVFKYVLQQVNQEVFSQPDLLVKNFGLVSDHLWNKAISQGREPSKSVLTMVPAYQGGYLHQAGSGERWRMFDYINHTATYHTVENSHQVFQAGLAIGEFLNAMAEFPVEVLGETISKFSSHPHQV